MAKKAKSGAVTRDVAAAGSNGSAGTPSSGPGFLLWQVSNHWQRTLRQALGPFNITHVQYILLSGIAELEAMGEEVTQARLAQQCRTDVMMTSQVVRTLESAGLVERHDHPTDRRAKRLVLTAEGLDKLNQTTPAVLDADENFFSALGKKQGKLIKHLATLGESERLI
ncbi:MarR family winged helix-turn-helix transcriptional regulator [Radicibacter daui]|uniref:MarR family winged helix-turn-helix transcriptional regulator n=1 Tax=Radicibacter daui TaxID=3064829 RepID=UPI004046BD26